MTASWSMKDMTQSKDRPFIVRWVEGSSLAKKLKRPVRRELMEEINVEVGEVRYLGTLENIFTFNGTAGHEIVMIYDGALTESGLYEQAVIVGEEADGEDIRAVWKSLDEFGEERSILYPSGLLEMLTK